MEAKRHTERAVGFGERGGAINQIKNNKEQRYQVKTDYPGENLSEKSSQRRVENQQTQIESGIKTETL